jgi:hypothetical protein
MSKREVDAADEKGGETDLLPVRRLLLEGKPTIEVFGAEASESGNFAASYILLLPAVWVVGVVFDNNKMLRH